MFIPLASRCDDMQRVDPKLHPLKPQPCPPKTERILTGPPSLLLHPCPSVAHPIVRSAKRLEIALADHRRADNGVALGSWRI